MNFFRFLILISCSSVFSQEARPITTAFSFLLLSPDAIASGKGDIGVASLPDAFSLSIGTPQNMFSAKKSQVLQ